MAEFQRYHLRVALEDIDPPVFRELDLSSDIPLAELHSVLQIAMGWQDYHMHVFEAMGQAYGEPDDELKIVDEEAVTLRAIAPTPGSQVVYEYDFGDSWRHLIEVLEIGPGGPGPARCLGGRRSAPPEDCGGPGGYQELLAALANPHHPEHEQMRSWAGGFDPERFDQRSVNQKLAGRQRLASRPGALAPDSGDYPLGSPELSRCSRWCEEDLAEIWAARSHKSLLRQLLPWGPPGSTSHHWEVTALLNQHRIRGGLTAEIALLALTCHRWDSCTARAIDAARDLLAEAELDALAVALLCPGDLALVYPVDSTALSQLQGGSRSARPGRQFSGVRVRGDAPYQIQRRIAPPLRRFAVGRALRRHLVAGGLADVLQVRAALMENRKRRGDAQGAAAVVAGAIDSFDSLSQKEQEDLLDLALDYPRSHVRKLALGILEDRRGHEAMLARARVDPDASIRRMADRPPTTTPELPF